ncbi:MAG TPA: hypothetical protein VG713_10670 [Pirellulales bacterium]|nr:hypothetical protein [Pirellulales bacterium]
MEAAREILGPPLPNHLERLGVFKIGRRDALHGSPGGAAVLDEVDSSAEALRERGDAGKPTGPRI